MTLEESLSAVESGAGGWVAYAEGLMRELIATGAEFTTDDFWARCSRPPVEPRALGAVTRSLLRQGELSIVGYRKSKRRECHSRPIPIYRPAGAN